MKILWNHVRNCRRRKNSIGIQNKFVFNIKITFLIITEFIYLCVVKINPSSIQDLLLQTHKTQAYVCYVTYFNHSISILAKFTYFFNSFIIYFLFVVFFFSNSSYLYWSLPIYLQHCFILFIQRELCIYSCASHGINQVMDTFMRSPLFNPLIL